MLLSISHQKNSFPPCSSNLPSSASVSLQFLPKSCSSCPLLFPAPIDDCKVTREWRGRQTKFTAYEYHAVVREVGAGKAHIAGFRQTRKRSEIAAAKANKNQNLRKKVGWKSVRDRYKHRQKVSMCADKCNEKNSAGGWRAR